MMLLMVSCDTSIKRPIDRTYLWPSSGIDEADSVMLQFEHRRNGRGRVKYIKDDLIERLESISARHSDNALLKARLAYIRTSKYLLNNNIDLARKELSSGMAFLDSADNHFDWFMCRMLMADLEEAPVSGYNIVIENLNYFERIGSEYGQSRTYLQLGNIMIDYRDSVRAAECYRKAFEISNKLGLYVNAAICRMNLANTLDRETSIKIDKQLLEDTLLKDEGMLHIWVCQDLYNKTGKEEYIEKGLALCVSKPYRDMKLSELPILIAMKGMHYENKGDHEVALKYFHESVDSIADRPVDARSVRLLYKWIGCAYGNMGYLDSACMMFYKSLVLRDSIEFKQYGGKVPRLDAKMRIELARKNMQLEKNRVVGWLVTALLVVFMSTAIIYMNHKRRSAVRRYEALKTRHHLQQSVVVHKIILSQSERLIEDMSRLVEDMKNKGELDEMSSNRLSRALGMYKGDGANREGFLQVQEELNTDFIDRLKSRFPTLTESQMRLASLIAAGADSRQICNILNIEMASLHKSRYRLRTRLGLTTEQNLVDFLRAFNRI